MGLVTRDNIQGSIQNTSLLEAFADGCFSNSKPYLGAARTLIDLATSEAVAHSSILVRTYCKSNDIQTVG